MKEPDGCTPSSYLQTNEYLMTAVSVRGAGKHVIGLYDRMLPLQYCYGGPRAAGKGVRVSYEWFKRCDGQ